MLYQQRFTSPWSSSFARIRNLGRTLYLEKRYSRMYIYIFIYSWQFIALVTDESTDILASLPDVANLQIIKGNKAPRGDTPWSDCIQNCIVLCED